MTSNSDQSGGAVRAAAGALLDPSSSIQAKMGAVEILERAASDEAIEILKQLIDYVYSGPRSEASDGLPDLAFAGNFKNLDARELVPVANLAARALARSDHPEGIVFLMVALTSSRVDLGYRLVAAYGLGGCVRPQSFETLASAVLDDEPAVREQAINSLKASFERLGPAARTRLDVQRAVESLVTLGLYEGFEGDPLKDETSTMARILLRQFFSSAVEARVLEYVRSAQQEENCTLGIEILEGLMSVEASRTLAEMLLDQGRAPPVYLAVGKALAGSKDTYIRQLAESILNESGNILGNMRNLISTRRSTITSMRREAARWILVG